MSSPDAVFVAPLPPPNVHKVLRTCELSLDSKCISTAQSQLPDSFALYFYSIRRVKGCEGVSLQFRGEAASLEFVRGHVVSSRDDSGECGAGAADHAGCGWGGQRFCCRRKRGGCGRGGWLGQGVNSAVVHSRGRKEPAGGG